MKIHLIRKETIEAYIFRNARSRPSLVDFLEKLKYADWEKPDDIKCTFNAADLLRKGSNRVIFDILGNAFRLICKYAFGDRKVHLFVCWIGTHAEYTALCRERRQYEISDY